MAIPVSDNFPGAALSGTNWSVVAGSITVVDVDDTAEGTTSDTFNIAKWAADTFAADQTASCVVFNGGRQTNAGICLRLTGTGASLTGYYCLAADDGNIYTGTITAGPTFTDIDSRAHGLNGSTDILTAQIVGTSIVLKKNGSAIGSPIVDATFATGQPGFTVYSDNRLKAFTGDNVGAAGNTGTGAVSKSPALAATGAYLLLEQEGFRFYNDDGSESAATAAGAQDANVTLPLGQNFRLRFIINATGDPPSTGYQLEFRKQGETGWSPVT